MIRHPIKSSMAVADEVKDTMVRRYTDPVGYVKEEWKEFEDGYNEIMNMNPAERAERFGEISGGLAVSLLTGLAGGGKALSTIAKKAMPNISPNIDVDTQDIKLKVSKPKKLRASENDLFWIIDLDIDFNIKGVR